MSAAGRCPYHVRQGLVDEKGELVLADVCGVKAAQGAKCDLAPFSAASQCYMSCPRFLQQQRGGERQMLIPKSEMEYLPELGGVGNFSEMELM